MNKLSSLGNGASRTRATMAIPAKTTEACSLCRSKTLCLAKNLTSEQLKGLDTLTRPLGPFKQGDTIFRMEDPFKSLFVIRSGCVKVETITYEGESCVDGFFFAGDLIGLEAIGDRTYRHDAIALEDCLICELPFTQLETLSSFVPHLQHKLLQLLGDKIRLTNETFIYARHLSAEQRLLLFFRLLCQKNIIRRERQDQSIRLPMSKCDIASYLGLRPESLSRALRKLEQKGIIVNHAKTIEFTDIEAILQIVGH